MSFHLNNTIVKDLKLLQRPLPDIIDIFRATFDYLSADSATQPKIFEQLSKTFGDNVTTQDVEQAIEALIALLIDVTRANASKTQVQRAIRDAGIIRDDDVLEVLGQFVTSKRNFIESSIKSANIRAYRLVNLEWRLEIKLASRSLLNQTNVQVTMKLYLHTEPKNENRDLLSECVGAGKVIHVDERRNRKDVIVQTDVNSLIHIIKTLEEALIESKSRRIRNIADALH